MEYDFFVYMLKDPDTHLPFYIGKGKKYRDRAHLKPSLWKDPQSTSNPFLYYKIQSIIRSGKEPIVERIHENITENEAYTLEEAYISQYGTRFSGEKNGILFNLSPGKGVFSGYKNPWSSLRRTSHQTTCKKNRIYDPTYDILFNDYVIKNKDRKTIAEENGCSIMLVKKRLQELGIKKPAGAQYPEKRLNNCYVCGKQFYTANKTIRKTCSKECYSKHRRKSRDE